MSAAKYATTIMGGDRGCVLVTIARRVGRPNRLSPLGILHGVVKASFGARRKAVNERLRLFRRGRRHLPRE